MTKRAVLILASSIGVVLSGGCGDTSLPTYASADPVSDTFASQIGPRGSATRAFSVRDTGRVAVTLTSVVPAVTVGIGVGIPNGDGANCNLSRSVETGPGSSAQLVLTADGGGYCVKVFDTGAVTGLTSFSVTVVHP